jgi:hypothetical protein
MKIMSGFGIGDKVKYKEKDDDYGSSAPLGMVGEIVWIGYNCNGDYAVRFNGFRRGHHLEGKLPSGSREGWYCTNRNIKHYRIQLPKEVMVWTKEKDILKGDWIPYKKLSKVEQTRIRKECMARWMDYGLD